MKKKILAGLLVTVGAITAAQATLQPFSSSAFSLASDGFSWLGGALSGSGTTGSTTRRTNDTGQETRPPIHWSRSSQTAGSPVGHHGGGLPSTVPQQGLTLPDRVTSSFIRPDALPGWVNMHAPSFADGIAPHPHSRPPIAFSAPPAGSTGGSSGAPAFTPLRLPDQGLPQPADDQAVAAVPEPATYALLLSGLGLLAIGRRNPLKPAPIKTSRHQ